MTEVQEGAAYWMELADCYRQERDDAKAEVERHREWFALLNTENDNLRFHSKAKSEELKIADQEIDRLRLVIAHEGDCTQAADDEAMRRGHEIEELREALAFVRAQIKNGCSVDLEPCHPVEFCTCVADAKSTATVTAEDRTCNIS